jgi:hypothetical protein
MAIGITVADVELFESVRLGLLDCTSKKEIENIFSKAKIEGFAEKTEFLHRAMQIQKVYGTPDGDVQDAKDDYEYYIKFYLKGEWKEYI